MDSFARTLVEKTSDEAVEKKRVDVALDRMQRDMSMLDDAASAIPQLSTVETVVLSSTVLVAFASPYALSAKVVELLVPAMSSLSAAVGFSAEYLGKVAVSQGKEVAAATLQCAAEAESLLAQALVRQASPDFLLKVGVATAGRPTPLQVAITVPSTSAPGAPAAAQTAMVASEGAPVAASVLSAAPPSLAQAALPAPPAPLPSRPSPKPNVQDVRMCRNFLSA